MTGEADCRKCQHGKHEDDEIVCEEAAMVVNPLGYCEPCPEFIARDQVTDQRKGADVIECPHLMDQNNCPACLRAEVERLKGVKPKWPPMPPAGEGLPRYGLRWNGPSTPLATPMDDGYWTPWHLADAASAALRAEVDRLRADLAMQAHANRERALAAEAEVERLTTERDDYKSIATEDGFVERAALVQATMLRVQADAARLRSALHGVIGDPPLRWGRNQITGRMVGACEVEEFDAAVAALAGTP